jgi:translation initiation factor 5B
MFPYPFLPLLCVLTQFFCGIKEQLGYKKVSVAAGEMRSLTNHRRSQQLHRTWHLIESFAASFCALNFIGAVRHASYPLLVLTLTQFRRSIFFLGLFAGGPLAIWTSYLVTIGCMLITAAVLAEICSALPLSGSIYIWAAESANPKFARLVGFVVAWWTCTAWMTFVAGNCQASSQCY